MPKLLCEMSIQHNRNEQLLSCLDVHIDKIWFYILLLSSTTYWLSCFVFLVWTARCLEVPVITRIGWMLNICMFIWYRRDLNHNLIVDTTMGNKRTRQHPGEHSRPSLAAHAAKRTQNTQCRRQNRADHRRHQQRLILQSERQDPTFEHTPSPECDRNPIEGQSSSSKAASRFGKNWAVSLLQETNTRGLEFQKMVVESILCSTTLQHVMPEYVLKRKKLLGCEAVCDSIASAWDHLKFGHSKDKYVARNVVEVAVGSTTSGSNMLGAAKCIGLNRRAVLRGSHRRQLLDAKEDNECWAKGDRKARKDSIPEEIKDLVGKWYLEETRTSPNMHDVVRRRFGRRQWEHHATHLLQENEVRVVSVIP